MTDSSPGPPAIPENNEPEQPEQPEQPETAETSSSLKPPPVPPHPPSPRELHPDCPRHPWGLLLSLLCLTAAADWLLYEAWPGLGWSFFLLVMWAWMLLFHRRVKTLDGRDLLLVLLMLASAVQASVATSFSNVLVLVLLTLYASGHFLHRSLGPFWRRALEGGMGLVWIPVAVARLVEGLIETTVARIDRSEGKEGSALVRWSRPLSIALPAALVALPFVFLLGGGNAVLGNAMEGFWSSIQEWFTDIEGPSEVRVVFWMAVSVLLVGLLVRKPASLVLARLESVGNWRLPRAGDLLAAVWRTRLILLVVNVLFFFANTSDVLYLWMNASLPADLTLSEFVHEGVTNLIASVVLAGVVLLGLFHQQKEVTNARGQRGLALLWILQNMFLISSVVLRLQMYVDGYQLTLLRVNLVFFLLLVGVGFVLLHIRIWHARNFTWLFANNLMAVFLLFFTVQFLDTNAYVAWHNYRTAQQDPGRQLDVDYLGELGPSAWPVLSRVADDSAHFGHTSEEARDLLALIAREESGRVEEEDWRSWQLRRSMARDELPLSKVSSTIPVESESLARLRRRSGALASRSRKRE